MNRAQPYRVVSLGDLVVDVILSVPQLPVVAGEHQMIHGLQLEPGGAGNFLIAGARLGMDMTSLAAVGGDVFGHSLLDMLQGEGVHVADMLHQTDGTTSVVFVLESAPGAHVFLGQYGQGEKVPLLETWQQTLASADAVQLWGYSLMEERLVDCVLQTAAFCHQHGIPVMFDPGPMFALSQPEHCQELLASATVVLLTEQELAVLGEHCPQITGPLALLEMGPAVVCVKQGQKGCAVYTRETCLEQPGYPVPVRDTNAAGDAFMAAFVYGYLSGWPLAQTAAFANAMGAAKVQKFGSGRQVPTAEELRKVLRDFAVAVEF